MATFDITRPDGRKFRITAPEGATQEEVLAYAQQQFSKPAEPVKPVTLGKEGMAESLRDEYRSRNWADRQLIAAGTALSNAYEGARQLVGRGDRQQIEANNVIRKENPVAGFVGDVALYGALPVARTMGGAVATGATMGVLNPSEAESTAGVVQDKAISTAVGGVTGAVGQVIGNALTNNLANKTAQAATQKGQNSVRDATLAQAQAAGYVMPKSSVNPTFVSNRLEGVAGKAALKQEATARNQLVTNELARKVLGLSSDTPIDEAALNSFRSSVSGPYQEVAALNPRAASAWERLREVRAESKLYWNHANRTADPASVKKAQALDQTAETLENLIDKVATRAGKPDLVPRLREARQRLAQSYDIEKALNPATGDVSARVFGKMLNDGKPLSGELETIGKMALAFPQFVGDGVKSPAAGVSKLEGVASVLMGTAGGTAMGPAGVGMAALPFASPAVRSALLSRFMQRGIAPAYQPSAFSRLGAGLGTVAPESLTALSLDLVK